VSLVGKPDPEHSPFLKQHAEIMTGQNKSQRIWLFGCVEILNPCILRFCEAKEAWSFVAASATCFHSHDLQLSTSDLLNPGIGPLLKLLVTGMVGLVLTRIARRIVTTDQRPAWRWATIGIGAMKQIAMEEQRSSREHLTVYYLQVLECLTYSFDVGTGLLSNSSMINAAHAV
jgi:hypothetical protein